MDIRVIPRAIFLISLSVSLFLIFSFVIISLASAAPNFSFIATASILCSVAISTFCFKKGFLKSRNETSVAYVFLVIIFMSAASYICLIPIFALLAYLFIRVIGDPHATDAGIAIWTISVIFPLGFATTIGAALSHKALTKSSSVSVNL